MAELFIAGRLRVEGVSEFCQTHKPQLRSALTFFVTSTTAFACDQLNMSSVSPTVRVIYFASVRTTLGLSHESIALPSVPTSLSTLIELIAQRHNDKHPASVLAACRWSVDNTLIEIDEIANWTLNGGEEVAAIPPVSGG